MTESATSIARWSATRMLARQAAEHLPNYVTR
jgi:hypothetical protein